MAITRTAMIDDDGSGTTGTIINNAWKQEFYNQIDGIGVWVSVPYSAGLYATTGGGSWAVTGANQVTLAYTLNNKTVTVAFQLINTAITGTPVGLAIGLPTASNREMSHQFAFLMGGATAGTGYATAAAGATVLNLYRDIVATPWAAGTAHVAGIYVYSIA